MAAEIRLCGGVTVDGDGSGLTGRLALLLAVLVLRGEQGVRRDELVELLWPHDPPADPGKLLNPLLSRLRRTVGPVEGRGLVRLAPPQPLRVDVLDARADVMWARTVLEDDPAAALHAAERAAEVLAGELLPAHDDPWTVAQRLRLDAQCGDALTLAAQAGVALGDGPSLLRAERAARALVDADPLQEAGAGMLIDVLVARGEEVAALQVYERLRTDLRRELGAAPGRRLRLRHAELLRGVSPLLPAALAAERATTIAGRAAALAAVEAALETERELPGPQLVIVSGPPGIGKTRLVAEVAARRHAAGATVLLARGQRAPTGPYAGIADALAPLVASADPAPLAFALGPLAADLARLLPALAGDAEAGAGGGGTRGGETRDGGARGRAASDPDTSRFRMFEAVRVLLASSGGEAGTLLVLDDAHWLDASSRPLVAHLLRAPELSGLTLLATARPPQPDRDDPLAALAESAVGVTRIALAPLDLAGVRELLALHRAEDLDATALRLHASTGGSPLLLRAALASGARAQDDLGEAVRGGLAWAGADVAAIAELLAVDGGRAGLDVLAAAAEITLADAGDRLDRACDAGLLVAGDGGASTLATMHDAVREALLAQLGGGRRAALHARLATAYERVCAGEEELVLVELARHWGAADGPLAAARAARYGERAARRALAALAFEQAAAHAAEAREQLERAGGGADADARGGTAPGGAVTDARGDGATPGGAPADDPVPTRLALLLLEGEAHNRASAIGPARAVLADALVLARRLGRDDLVARAAIDHVGHRLGAAIQDPELIAVLEEGWAAVPPRDAILRARLAGGLAASLLRGPAERRDRLSRTAVELARASGDRATLAETLLWRHVGLLWRADPAARSPLVDEGERLARAAGRTDLALHARMLRFTDLLEAGRIADARTEAAGWAAEAEAARAPYQRWASAICRPTLDLLDGRADDARAALLRAQRLAAPLGADRAVLAAHSGQWLTLRMTEGAAGETAQQLAAVIATQDVPQAWHAALAWCRAAGGEHAAARAGVTAVLARDLGTIVDPNRLTALSFLAVAAVAADAPQPQLDAIHAALAPHAGGWIVQHYGGAVHGPVLARLALLDAARGRADAASSQLDAAQAAIDAAGAAGLQPQLDRVRALLDHS